MAAASSMLPLPAEYTVTNAPDLFGADFEDAQNDYIYEDDAPAEYATAAASAAAAAAPEPTAVCAYGELLKSLVREHAARTLHVEEALFTQLDLPELLDTHKRQLHTLHSDQLTFTVWDKRVELVISWAHLMADAHGCCPDHPDSTCRHSACLLARGSARGEFGKHPVHGTASCIPCDRKDCEPGRAHFHVHIKSGADIDAAAAYELKAIFYTAPMAARSYMRVQPAK